MKKVVIIGGGLAGIGAATRLVSVGFKVVLFESRSFLGGRFYSFREPTTGDFVDNGQHLLTGFYYNTFELLEILGTRDLVKVQKNLDITFIENGGGLYRLNAPRLKAPLGMLWALLRFKNFPKQDVWRLIWKGRGLLREDVGLDNITAGEWLGRVGQSDKAISSLWRPLILATMNSDIDEVSAYLLQSMLRIIFSFPAVDIALAIPRAGLSELVATPATRYITDKGGELRLGSPVEKIVMGDGRVDCIIDKDGTEYRADAFISAVQPYVLENLIEGEADFKERLGSWNYSTIISVNLWFDREVSDRDMVGLTDSRFQWCFDRSKIGKTRYPCVTLVISAAREETNWPREKLIEVATDEVKRCFAGAANAKLLHAQVIREPKATVLISPGRQAARMGAKTEWPNLFLAGDWTDTGLPATVEGAVKSGFTCADLVANISGFKSPYEGLSQPQDWRRNWR